MKRLTFGESEGCVSWRNTLFPELDSCRDLDKSGAVGLGRIFLFRHSKLKTEAQAFVLNSVNCFLKKALILILSNLVEVNLYSGQFNHVEAFLVVTF